VAGKKVKRIDLLQLSLGTGVKAGADEIFEGRFGGQLPRCAPSGGQAGVTSRADEIRFGNYRYRL
jgi:hypothetical protein